MSIVNDSQREALVRDYFTPPEESFWQWQDDGDAIAWKDNKTIVFSQELAVLLKHVAPNGLPRIGSLLLLIAATRKNWSVDGSEAGLLTGVLANVRSGEAHLQSATSLFERVMTGLDRIRALDESMRTPLAAKAAILQLVFEDRRPKIPARHAFSVVDAIRPGLMALVETSPKAISSGYGQLLLMKDLADLAPGLERVTAEAIRLRLATGLEELPLPAEIEPPDEAAPTSDLVRNLIDHLLDNDQHGGLARLAKQMLATTALPRKLTEQREQETGGFSDIANRGTPDRLLLTELAQDGLTLAVRVAMNEAMYLHRETPPAAPRLRRELLIDSGVRAWGTPRVFAAGAALAFAATTPPGAGLGASRGSGSQIDAVDLTTTEGLVAHLSALEPDPHLAEALPQFAARIAAADEPVEAIVIMPADAYAELDVARALRELVAERVYVATVSCTGAFRLIERRPRGERLIRQANLDLDQLLSRRRHRLFEKRSYTRLPAIFRADPFPLLLPHSVQPQRSWSHGNYGALAITGDGRLMHWTEAQKGALQLYDRLPKGELWWAAPMCVQGKTHFVYGHAVNPSYVSVNIWRREITTVQLRCGAIRGIAFHNGTLMGVTDSHVFVFDTETGEVEKQLRLPSTFRWRGGRFFVDLSDAWHAMSHDGHGVAIEVLPPFQSSLDSVVHMWDAWNYEGPLALTARGEVFSARLRVRLELPDSGEDRQCRVERVAPDGLHVTGYAVQEGRCQPFHFRIGPQLRVLACTGPLLDSRIQAIARPAPIRTRFRSIGVTDNGSLALRSRKGQVLGVVERQGTPLFDELPRDTLLASERNFEVLDVLDTKGLRYKLSTADWSDGSRAFLDSRGLLHLQENDLHAAEVTIVLSEGELTGWCSDGRTFGKQYFLPDSDQFVTRGVDRRTLVDNTIGRFAEGIRAAG